MAPGVAALGSRPGGLVKQKAKNVTFTQGNNLSISRAPSGPPSHRRLVLRNALNQPPPAQETLEGPAEPKSKDELDAQLEKIMEQQQNLTLDESIALKAKAAKAELDAWVLPGAMTEEEFTNATNVMDDITLERLFEANVHLGHRKGLSRFEDKYGMKPYIWGIRKGMFIIRLDKTLEALQTACDRVRSAVRDGKQVWFVGTDPMTRAITTYWATKAGQPFVSTLWKGGTITNFPEYLKKIDELNNYQDFLRQALKFNQALRQNQQKTEDSDKVPAPEPMPPKE